MVELLFLSMFKSVVIFYAEIYQNNIYFFLIFFLKSAHQNDSKHKKINFFKNTGATAFPNAHKIKIKIFI